MEDEVPAYNDSRVRMTEAEIREELSVPEVICDVSPIQYLHQVGLLDPTPSLWCHHNAAAAGQASVREEEIADGEDQEAGQQA